MNAPQSISKNIEQVFSRIHRESMQGIPILNSKLKVQALGFQVYEERVVGILITPWVMNLVLLPAQGEDWSDLTLGQKKVHEFPSQKCKFMVNDIEGIGVCQMHSLFSPMNEFSSHEQAVRAARDFIDKLMVDTQPGTANVVDEDLLGQIMRGEKTPKVDLDDFATIEPHEPGIPITIVSDTKKSIKKKLDRRALLRGQFLEGG